MREALPLLFTSIAAVFLTASLAHASNPPAGSSGPAQLLPINEIAGPFLAAIQSAQASIIIAEPKCGEGTTLTGAFVMETPPRDGFPLDATTFASPRGTFTSVTTTGNESEAVISEVARILNDRADNYVKRLLRNCTL
jgi:hypothetical protein